MPVSYRSNLQHTLDRQTAPVVAAPRRELTAADFITPRHCPERGSPKWSEEEIAMLRELSILPLTASQIAARMGRTPAAVRCRASIEGIPLRYASHRGESVNRWTQAELQTLVSLHHKGAKRSEMRAALPNRTDGAIGARLWMMGYRRRVA